MTPRVPADSQPVSVVSGLGLIVFDQQMFVRQFPTADTKIFAEEFRTQIGGPVPTALAQLRRLGVGARFLGAWADDLAGRVIEQDLARERIAFDADASRSAGVTGTAHVWVETTTGRRTVISLPPDSSPDPATAATFGRSAHVLHLDGWGGEAAVAAAGTTRAAGGLVTLDAGSVKPTTGCLLPLAEVVNAPKRFLRAYCGTDDPDVGAKTLLRLGPRIVTVTDGDRGAGVYTEDQSIWLPAFPVRAVDTCGAGDVFCGGLIDAVLSRLEPEHALRFAMAAAALKVTRPGNREALAGREEILGFLDRF